MVTDGTSRNFNAVMPVWVLLKPTDMMTKGGYMFPRFRNTGLTIRISKNAALKILLIFGSIFGITSLQIGGTSLLIMEGVALETVTQIESQMTMRHYKGFLD